VGPLPLWPLVAVFVQARPAPVRPDGPALSVSAGVEVRRDRFHYRFENPSSFGTAELVPHDFRQSYVADNRWLVARATYGVGRQQWATEVALAPERVTDGEDFDTFHQPDGDVVTSGTRGDVSLRSWRVAQRLLDAGSPRVRVRAGYVYRRDRARFHPADRVVTHTRPPSVTRTYITTRETTISETHELQFSVERIWHGGAWELRAEAAGTPALVARLTTRLPDKYPGRDIVFVALGGAAGLRVDAAGRWGRWTLGVSADGGRAWSYLGGRQFGRTGLGASVRAGVALF
jgi:hypothetical protein